MMRDADIAQGVGAQGAGLWLGLVVGIVRGFLRWVGQRGWHGEDFCGGWMNVNRCLWTSAPPHPFADLQAMPREYIFFE